MIGTIVAVISDTHVGGSTALAPPKFTIHTGRADETQQVLYNKMQEDLYKNFVDFVDYAKTLAGIRGKTRKKRLVFLHLGDVVDGLHHNSVQVMNEVEDQVEAACNLLRPLANISDAFYLTYGTGAHNGGTAEYETTIGEELGISHGWSFTLDIDDVLFDISHHGRIGRKPWSSSAATMALEVTNNYVISGQKPPNYILRGHNHKIDDSGIKVPYCRVISLPSWQLKTAYAQQAVPNDKVSDIGGLIIDTSDPTNPNLSRMRYQHQNSIAITKV